ncbi:MAG TPA: glycosyltransferase family 4 protein [Chloroflexi bacterium]|nr:glycosyltransferase family 4 protein [Chloroflexota bacterium]
MLTHNYPRFPGDFSGTFVEALCEELARQQQRVTVWAPYDPAYRRPLEEAVRLRLYRYAWPESLHRLGYMRTMQSDLALRLEAYALSPALFARGIQTVMTEARRDRPDVLHAHWLLPNGFIGAVVSRQLRIPLAISIPGSDAQVARSNPLFRAMARFALRQATLLTANSADLRDAVIPLGADLHRFDMIIYGTDPAALRPDSTGVATLRQQLNIAPDAVVSLCVGRMVPKKGFDVLIRALADPILQALPIVGVMVGEGDDKAAWQALAVQLGVAERLRWVGNVPKTEIGAYYNLADFLAMPSVSRPADGLNVCVLDAMSCGKPVIGTPVAGNPLAIVDGVTGVIVPEQDPATLAAALALLAANPALRQRMGAAARKRIEDELGWPHLARRYITHFEQMAMTSSHASRSAYPFTAPEERPLIK